MIDDTNFASVVCSFCSRLRSLEKHTCDAFPERIPDVIWNGSNHHGSSVEGDGGLLFNSINRPDGQESEYVI